MAEKRLTFCAPDSRRLLVRTIVEEDIELLRIWKNTYRDRFFFNALITPDMQHEWFRSYLQAAHDFMFVVIRDDERVGCLGFRRRDDRVDFYNIILGDQRSARKGCMSLALDWVCTHVRLHYPGVPIMVSVLRDNPDLGWYFRRGFTLTCEHETFVELTRNSR